jgi:hypothetical protein
MKYLTPLLIAAIISASSVPSALACSCLPPPPPKEAMEKSTAVFSGKVTKIELDEAKHRRTVTIEVDRAWKGMDKKTVVITTASDGAMCGYGFQKDKSYLVYAHGEDGKLSTNICTRTRGIEQAKADIEALGEGKKL